MLHGATANINNDNRGRKILMYHRAVTVVITTLLCAAFIVLIGSCDNSSQKPTAMVIHESTNQVLVPVKPVNEGRVILLEFEGHRYLVNLAGGIIALDEKKQ